MVTVQLPDPRDYERSRYDRIVELLGGVEKVVRAVGVPRSLHAIRQAKGTA